MKKYSWIVALVIALSMVFMACPPGGPDGVEYDVTEITLTTYSGVEGIDAMDSPEDIALGKGFITGEFFTQLRNAPPGSFIRVYLEGTENLNWNTIGAVGIGDPENSEGNRCDFAPKGGVTYYNDVQVSSVFALTGGANAEVVFVIVWGEHKITKVELYEPQTELPPQDPVAGDFSFGNLSQNLADGVTIVEIEPRFGKSQGAITIYYEGIDETTYTKSTTLPNEVGRFKVTFDVAAAAGFNAATGLDAGTLIITAIEVKPVVITINAKNTTAFTGANNPNFFYFPITFPAGFDIENFTHYQFTLKLFDDEAGTNEVAGGWHGTIKFVTETAADPTKTDEWDYTNTNCGQAYNFTRGDKTDFRNPGSGAPGYNGGNIGGAIVINGNADIKFIEIISVTYTLEN